LCAADYGVPQTRHRAILVASRIPAHRVGPPEPTRAEHPGDGDLFGPALLGWVSMADALGPDWPDRAAWTVTGDRHVFADIGVRRELAAYRRTRGEGCADRHGDRPDTPADRPAPTVTGKARSDMWVLRNNNTANAAVRALDEPAPTLFFGGRGNAVDWMQSRPSTTVQGDPQIAPPGPGDREGGEPQFGPATVRVSVAEAACLQGFRADFPWQGTQTACYQQVGNAVPPPLAAAVVGHLLDVDWRPIVAGYLARTALTSDREVAS
jgi:DNA (cytosine-5)-methyltransferase 1